MPTKLRLDVEGITLFDRNLPGKRFFERESFAFWQNGFAIQFDISPIRQDRVEKASRTSDPLKSMVIFPSRCALSCRESLCHFLFAFKLRLEQ